MSIHVNGRRGAAPKPCLGVQQNVDVRGKSPIMRCGENPSCLWVRWLHTLMHTHIINIYICIYTNIYLYVYIICILYIYCMYMCIYIYIHDIIYSVGYLGYQPLLHIPVAPTLHPGSWTSRRQVVFALWHALALFEHQRIRRSRWFSSQDPGQS